MPVSVAIKSNLKSKTGPSQYTKKTPINFHPMQIGGNFFLVKRPKNRITLPAIFYPFHNPNKIYGMYFLAAF